ncbi:hypothetical protein [Croceicoccus gelatinilyticus]|nr:hypothetical protein [Croceicoccus gelatinilyticus]MBS7670129.1 hypothetical protein [Croceicoccus gelatinilyticus]
MAHDNRYRAELQNLLAEMRDHPERNHDATRQRIAVLRKMVEAETA